MEGRQAWPCLPPSQHRLPGTVTHKGQLRHRRTLGDGSLSWASHQWGCSTTAVSLILTGADPTASLAARHRALAQEGTSAGRPGRLAAQGRPRDTVEARVGLVGSTCRNPGSG